MRVIQVKRRGEGGAIEKGQNKNSVWENTTVRPIKFLINFCLFVCSECKYVEVRKQLKGWFSPSAIWVPPKDQILGIALDDGYPNKALLTHWLELINL